MIFLSESCSIVCLQINAIYFEFRNNLILFSSVAFQRDDSHSKLHFKLLCHTIATSISITWFIYASGFYHRLITKKYGNCKHENDLKKNGFHGLITKAISHNLIMWNSGSCTAKWVFNRIYILIMNVYPTILFSFFK